MPFKDRLGAEKQNKYYAKISSQQPTDLVTKFFEESPQRVQDAASQAVKELAGDVPIQQRTFEKFVNVGWKCGKYRYGKMY